MLVKLLLYFTCSLSQNTAANVSYFRVNLKRNAKQLNQLFFLEIFKIYTLTSVQSSKTNGIIARLRHFAPQNVLLNIYQSQSCATLPNLWYNRLGASCPDLSEQNSTPTKTSSTFDIFCPLQIPCHTRLIQH